MKHLAIYTRISGLGQNEASQLPDLERWVAGQSQECVWYRDTASGRTMNRPSWSKLMEAVREGKVEAIVVSRLDRLGRTAKGLTALFQELIERKVNLISLRDSVDLNSPSGRLLGHVLASVSQYETEVRSERVAAGIKVAKAKGKRWGGSKRGWRRKSIAPKVNDIRSLYKQGMTITQIARITSLSRPTVYRILDQSAAPLGNAQR